MQFVASLLFFVILYFTEIVVFYIYKPKKELILPMVFTDIPS